MRKVHKILLWIFVCGALLLAAIQLFLSTEVSINSFQPVDRLSVVDQALEKLKFGNIAFNVPTAMNLQNTASIQLKLSVVTPIEELKNQIEAEGLRQGARVHVSDRMEARLSGSNFTITAVTPEDQAISGQATTEWQWDIKPLDEGKQYLHLTLAALITVNGISTPRVIRVFNKTVEVKVTWQQSVESFLSRNWQWLWAMILVPIAGLLWKMKKAPSHNGAPGNN